MNTLVLRNKKLAKDSRVSTALMAMFAALLLAAGLACLGAFPQTANHAWAEGVELGSGDGSIDFTGEDTSDGSGSATDQPVYAEPFKTSNPLEAIVVSGTWINERGLWWYQLDQESKDRMSTSERSPRATWVIIGAKRYYFNNEGYMQSGFVTLDNKRFYLGKSNDGSMKIGWQKVNGLWYYIATDGVIQTGERVVDGVTYYLNVDGAMYTGWRATDNKWYYYHGSGAKAFGWIKLKGYWYFLDHSTGERRVGEHSIGGQTYYFREDGSMYIGWRLIDNEWHYYQKSGAKAYSWCKLGRTWYYLHPTTGVMQTGWLNKAGKTYYMGESGAMFTGWRMFSNKWYYFDRSGALQKNKWIQNKYWVDSSGVMTMRR